MGPEETFAALWQRRVQALLIEPGVRYAGFRCRSCGRLHFSGGPCLECGGKMARSRTCTTRHYVVAGPTERRGTQRIAHTLVVNPGRLADGSAAWLDWRRGKEEPVEFCNC